MHTRLRIYLLIDAKTLCVQLASVLLLMLSALHCNEARSSLPLPDLLYRTVGGSDDTIVVLTFQNVRECVKCQIYLDDAMTCLRKRLGKEAPIKLVGAITCQRPIELNAFQLENDMFDAIIMDDGSLKSELGLPLDIRLVVIDTSRVIIGRLRQKGYEADGCVEWQ